MRVLLDDAFEVLSDRDREVLRLRFSEDLTQTEISKLVGVSQMQVSRIIRQALRALRRDIESTERETDAA
jgi:RNA polymerase sigma-B factor